MVKNSRKKIVKKIEKIISTDNFKNSDSFLNVNVNIGSVGQDGPLHRSK